MISSNVLNINDHKSNIADNIFFNTQDNLELTQSLMKDKHVTEL